MKTKELTLMDLAKRYSNEETARALLESWRWPNGRVCPRCGCDKTYALKGKAESRKPTPPGRYKCPECRKNCGNCLFTVRIGTIMEESKIPLSTWLMVTFLMLSSKKSISANQVHRMFGITYKSAWFMCHRIRHGMKESASDLLTGVVEVDETYVGGKPRRGDYGKNLKKFLADNPGYSADWFRNSKPKTPVVALVPRDGRARGIAMVTVNLENVREKIEENISKKADLLTDESPLYKKLGKEFKSHGTTCHYRNQFSKKNGIHTNTAESYFSLIKRAIFGAYHNVSPRHLQAYVDEWTFRWNQRELSDADATANAVRMFEGKRLTYQDTDRP